MTFSGKSYFYLQELLRTETNQQPHLTLLMQEITAKPYSDKTLKLIAKAQADKKFIENCLDTTVQNRPEIVLSNRNTTRTHFLLKNEVDTWSSKQDNTSCQQLQ
jgi:hypothetical protein